MKSIPQQVDDSTQLAAADFNEIPREEENLITSSGQTLTSSDLHQMARAASHYGSNGDTYTDAGAANAYSLVPIGSNKNPPEYKIGQRVRFFAANNNTTTAVTLQIATIGGPLGINRGSLEDGGTPLLSGGDVIRAGQLVECIYDQTPDTAIKYWRLNQITDFDIDIQIPISGFETRTRLSSEGIVVYKDSGTSNEAATVSSGRIATGSTSEVRTGATVNGMVYDGNTSPGDPAFKSMEIRRSAFTFTFGSSWVSDPTLSKIKTNSSTNIILTGLVIGTKILSAVVTWNVTTVSYSVPVSFVAQSSGGFVQLTSLTTCNNFAIPITSTVIVEYDASSL